MQEGFESNKELVGHLAIFLLVLGGAIFFIKGISDMIREESAPELALSKCISSIDYSIQSKSTLRSAGCVGVINGETIKVWMTKS